MGERRPEIPKWWAWYHLDRHNQKSVFRLMEWLESKALNSTRSVNSITVGEKDAVGELDHEAVHALMQIIEIVVLKQGDPAFQEDILQAYKDFVGEQEKMEPVVHKQGDPAFQKDNLQAYKDFVGEQESSCEKTGSTCNDAPDDRGDGPSSQNPEPPLLNSNVP